MDKLVRVRKKKSKRDVIVAKARLQFQHTTKEVEISCEQSSARNVSGVVDRIFSGSTVMRKYSNIKIMDFKNKAREIFPDIPEDSVVVFRDVHQMADIIFGKHLAKSLAAWDARISDRIKSNENKVFRRALKTLETVGRLNEPQAEPEEGGDEGPSAGPSVAENLVNSCNTIWQLTSLRGDDFLPKLYSKELARYMLACVEADDIEVCISCTKIFWFVSCSDKGTQMLWRKNKIVSSLILAIEKHAEALIEHPEGMCVFSALYRELVFHDPDLEGWGTISSNVTIGRALLALLSALNFLSAPNSPLLPTILCSLSTIVDTFEEDLEDGVSLATFAARAIHHSNENVWLLALYCSSKTLGSSGGRPTMCKEGGWHYIERINEIVREKQAELKKAEEAAREASIRASLGADTPKPAEGEEKGEEKGEEAQEEGQEQQQGLANPTYPLSVSNGQFETYVAMALNSFTTGAVWIGQHEEKHIETIKFMENLPSMLSTEDDLGNLLFRLSGSLNVVTASTTCAAIANLVSLGVSLSVESCSEFLKVIERPAATDVCTATASALSTALISQSFRVADTAGGMFFLNLIIALGKRMKYGCEPETQKYLSASMLSIVKQGTISKIEDHKMMHRIVSSICKIPSFSKTCDWFALDCTVSSLWVLAQADACCNIIAHSDLIVDMFKILRELDEKGSTEWSAAEITVRKRIIGTLFLVSVTNRRGRHTIIEENYAREVVAWLDEDDVQIVTWTSAMFWDAIYTSPSLANELLKFKILSGLVHVATLHPGVGPITRQFAAGALEAIADAEPAALDEEQSHGLGLAIMEKLYVHLLKDHDIMLNEIGCRGLADLALHEARAKDLCGMKAVRSLVQVIDRSLRKMEAETDPTTGEALGGKEYKAIVMFGTNALRNLSMWHFAQLKIAREALSLLLRVRRRLLHREVVDDVECAIYNIGRNPKTVNLLYKAQLKVATAMHIHDKEKGLRELFEWKSKSKQIRRRITDSGAQDREGLNTMEPDVDEGQLSTIWDSKRIASAAESHIPFPLAAESDLVFADDKVRIHPVRTLHNIISRAPCLTLASGRPEKEKYRYGNVWLPSLASYKVPKEDEATMIVSPGLLRPVSVPAGGVTSASSLYDPSKSTFSSTAWEKTPTQATGPAIMLDDTLLRTSRPSSPTMAFEFHSDKKKMAKKNRERKKEAEALVAKLVEVADAKTASHKIKSPLKKKKVKTPPVNTKRSKFTVHLQPENAHEGRKILFHPGAVKKPNQRVHLARWQASLGSSNAETTPIYELPDKTLTHFYVKTDLQHGRHPGHPHRFPGAMAMSTHFPGVHTVVDYPLHEGTLQPPQPFSNDSLEVYSARCQEARPLVCETSTIPYADTSILLKVQLKRKSGVRKSRVNGGRNAIAGPSSAHDGAMKKALGGNTENGDDYTDEELFDDSSDDEEEGPKDWSLFRSVFRGREKSSESRDFYDREEWLRARMLDIDWKRLLPSKDWIKILGGGKEVMIHRMEDVKDSFAKLYDPICDCFEHYAIINPKVSVVSFNTFKMFLNDLGLIDPLSKFMNVAAYEKAFIIANKEESGTLDEETASLNRANDDRSLMRFEWLHMLVRIAYAKYVQTLREVSTAREAMELFVEKDLIPNLDPDSRDSNEFRKAFLYTEQMDVAFNENMYIFQPIWKRFSTKSRHDGRMIRRMTLKDWLTVWTALTVFDEDFDKTKAKLVFERSKMKVVDDWKDAARGRVLCFEDFLEGISRIANIVPIPSNAEIEKLGVPNKSAGLALRAMHNNGSYRLWSINFYKEKAMYGDMRKMTEKLQKFADIMNTKWGISHWNPANSGTLS
jgi:hypothetical protein